MTTIHNDHDWNMQGVQMQADFVGLPVFIKFVYGRKDGKLLITSTTCIFIKYIVFLFIIFIFYKYLNQC